MQHVAVTAAARSELADLASALGMIALVVFGLGLMIGVPSPLLGAWLRRLAGRVIAVCAVALVAHILLIDQFGGSAPPLVVMLLYVVAALMLLQGLINLLFGPAVGSRVLADLLSSLLHGLVAILAAPVGLLRGLLRRQ